MSNVFRSSLGKKFRKETCFARENPSPTCSTTCEPQTLATISTFVTKFAHSGTATPESVYRTKICFTYKAYVSRTKYIFHAESERFHTFHHALTVRGESFFGRNHTNIFRHLGQSLTVKMNDAVRAQKVVGAKSVRESCGAARGQNVRRSRRIVADRYRGVIPKKNGSSI